MSFSLVGDAKLPWKAHYDVRAVISLPLNHGRDESSHSIYVEMHVQPPSISLVRFTAGPPSSDTLDASIMAKKAGITDSSAYCRTVGT
jgi:hypothetical protein